MTGERLRPGDEAALGTILQDPRVARMLFPHRPPDDDEVGSILRRNVEHWNRHGFGLWLLRDRADGSLVGRGGLLTQHLLDREEVEAGWAIVPERQREGLATELARTCVTLGFGPLGCQRLISFTLAENLPSRRVMEKAGFRYEREFSHAGLPHVLYAQEHTVRWGAGEIAG